MLVEACELQRFHSVVPLSKKTNPKSEMTVVRNSVYVVMYVAAAAAAVVAVVVNLCKIMMWTVCKLGS